ncbi:MAG: hypothetical protein ACK58N_13335 [Synechocystis sp.]
MAIALDFPLKLRILSKSWCSMLWNKIGDRRSTLTLFTSSTKLR